MPAGKYHMICDQGATFARTLTWRDANDALVNLTGYTARMQVRPYDASDDVYLSLTTENGGITLGGALGTIALLATATQTASIIAGTWAYDLELVSGSYVTRLVQGNFIVDGEVTR